jgi:hypothetical protein
MPYILRYNCVCNYTLEVNSMRITLMLVIGFLFGAITLPAGAQEETAESETPALNPADATHLRFAQFSPDTQAVDFYLDGEMSDWTGLEYPVATDWKALNAGNHEFAIVPADATPSDAIIGPTSLNFNAQSWYTIAAVGSLENETITTFVFEENTDNVIPGTARITFFNAMDGRPVDFYRNEVPYTTGLDFGETFTDMHDVDTVMYQSVTGGQSPEVMGELRDVSMREGYNYLIAAIGAPGSGEIYIAPTNHAEFLIGQGRLEAPGTIVQAVAAENLTGQLGRALSEANLTDLLSGAGPYTLFAPAEFRMEDLHTDDPAEMARILSHHIVLGEVLSQDLANAAFVTTLGGDRLPVRVSNGVIHIDGQRVLTVNIPATNGVVHLISGVLMPDDEE